MTEKSIQVHKLTPRIGAEISGIKLSEPITEQAFREINDALMEHQVIFFRDQELTLEQHKAFGRLFGELHIHPASPPPKGHPEVLVVYADENTKLINGAKWHSDVSCDETPPMGSILHLHTLPKSGGGDTLFSSMYAAYEALSEPMKEFLSQLTAIHDGEHVYRRRYTNRSLEEEAYPQTSHPVIRTHPVTGKKAIYVNTRFTTRINEVTPEESQELLSFLYTHIARPDFQCRFMWQPNSVAFWDNRCVQHMAMWDYYPEIRSGFRVTIKGDRPF